MASECSTSFTVTFILRVDAEITLDSVYAALQPGFTNIYYWRVRFTYVTGDPASTGFRLNSADGLTGTFDPSAPLTVGDNTQVRNGVVEGTVTAQLAPDAEVTYNGTITILQA